MYSVLSYGRMARDAVRMDAYARAIARVVTPGSVVLDLGAGTGICSLLAARAGAARVHAVEPNPAVWLLPALAAENGVADRITVHAGSSFDLELPEKVDVVISDLRGGAPLHDDHLADLRDARARLLKPGGVMLPTRDRLMIAVVEAEGLARELVRAHEGFVRQGLAAGAVRRSLINDVYTDKAAPLRASDVLSSSAEWAAIDYGAAGRGVVEGTVELTFKRTGIANGLTIWFEATVYEELGFTTAPGHDLAYGRLFLPLEEDVRVEHGDRARVVVRADERGERWGWDVAVLDGSDKVKASFRQSTFLGAPASVETLLRSATTHRPVRSAHGELLLDVLQAMGGTSTTAEIADAVIARRGAAASGPEASERIRDAVRTAVGRYAR